MNICNFGKVLIARASKDLKALQWWNNRNSENEENSPPLYTIHLKLQDRFSNYENFVSKYPKLHLDFNTFQKKVYRIQDYLTQKKYWQNSNKSGELQKFIQHFSLQNWVQLPESEKVQHCLENCTPCNTIHLNTSRLHKSVSSESATTFDQCRQATANLMETITPTSTTKTKGIKVIKSIVNIVQPIVESTINMKFDNNLSESVTLLANLTPKEHNKALTSTVTDSKRQIQDSMTENDNDVTNCLSSLKSYNQYNKERLQSSFETPSAAVKRTENKLHKEAKGLKVKQHHGKFNNYKFDKEKFLNEVQQIEDGTPVNWTKLARKYNVSINNKFPLNAGQTIMEYAKHNNINVNRFNSNTRVSQHDYIRRIRRAKKIINIGNKKISMPTTRTMKSLKKTIRAKLDTGEIYIGEQVAPKQVQNTIIGPSGELLVKKSELYGRKIPLDVIRKSSLLEQEKLGILRWYSDQEYCNMSLEDVCARLSRIQESTPENRESAINLLKTLERQRKIKLWHDHSDILNHSYVSFMVSWIYDEANYITDEEYKIKYPQKRPVNVQSLVEKPYLYCFGQSGSTDIEQMTYIETRLKDLDTITFETDCTSTRHVKVFDILRVFSGDGPARQFEIGQQRGGNFSCICGIPSNQHDNLVRSYAVEPMTLDERCKLFISPSSVLKLQKGNLNPFQNLRKEELVKELEFRNVDTTELLRPELQENLSTLLHGVSRPPALMIPDPFKTSNEINIPSYEILGTEPLHDLSNIIVNVITELPHHLKDKQLQKEYEQFSQSTIGEKNQVKGSDARLFLIKLAKFTLNFYQDDKIDSNIMNLINSLVEITNLCYSDYESRNPKRILRLYNQSFLFAVLCRSVIGIPKKMTSRRFFGSHFHSIVVHAPETSRIFNLRSIVTEQEERCFGDLRKIAEQTTNRQASYVCDNTVLRFNQQQKTKQDAWTRQDSIIKRQAKLLPQRPNTIIPANLVKTRPVLFQKHLERIADYLLPGEGIWWHTQNGDIIFHDGPEEPCSHQEGPFLYHFRSSSLKDIHKRLKADWERVTSLFEEKQLALPLKRIKAFDESEKPVYIVPTQDSTYQDAASNPDLTSEPDLQEQENPTDTMTSHDITQTAEIDEHSNVIADMTNKIHDDDNTTMDYKNIFDKRQDREDRNTTIKEKYRSFIKVVKWTEKLRPYQNHCPESQQLPGTDQEQHEQRPKPCKRKLFQTDMTVGSHLGTSTGTRTTDVIMDIVGSTPEYQSYIKYRRMSKANPSDKSIRQSYQQCEAKVQIQVSEQRSHLKRKENPSLREQQLTIQSEELLKKWGIYYY